MYLGGFGVHLVCIWTRSGANLKCIFNFDGGDSVRFAASTKPTPSRVVVEPRRRVRSKRAADGVDGEPRQVCRKPAAATGDVFRRPTAAAPADASDAEEDQPLAVDNVEAGEPATRVEPMAAVAPGPPEGVEIFKPPGCRSRFLQPWDSLGQLGCSKCRKCVGGCSECRLKLGWRHRVDGCWEHATEG